MFKPAVEVGLYHVSIVEFQLVVSTTVSQAAAMMTVTPIIVRRSWVEWYW